MDRAAVTLNLDKISLLVTAHTGVFPIAQRYAAITTKPPETSRYAASEHDFFMQKPEELKFSAPSTLVFQLIAQAQIFIANAASQ